jgi:acyl-CoA thioester hydrolase
MIEINELDVDVTSTCRQIYECTLPLRFADMDADGHVNNAVYYRFMEEARMRWVQSLGLAMIPPAPVPVLAASACVFRAPLVYPGNITIAVNLGRIGKSSVRTHYLVRSGNVIAAEGYGVSVWVDAQTQRPIALPDAVRALDGECPISEQD